MAVRRQRPRIHITAVAASAADEIKRLGVKGVEGMIALAQSAAGERYRVTASARMILAKEDEKRGGRFDDAARAREITTLLADENVAALVTIRGGAWFTRILEQISFEVLSRRRRTIHLFGFSEMTSLIAVGGQYDKAVGLYDLGPGFLYGGTKRHVCKNVARFARSIDLPAGQHEGFAAGWALAQYPRAFADFFREVAGILDGRGSPRVPRGRLLAGSLPSSRTITITGGNLSVIVPLIGSRLAGAVETAGKWLAIEDVNESAGAIDRMMAALKLAGLFDRADGIILGNFHDEDTELSRAAFEMLKHHLGPKRRTPIVGLDNFGHVWPIAPLPMHREVTLRCRRTARGQPRVTIDIPWSRWAHG